MIGKNLELSAVVVAVVQSEEAWQAFASFCRIVMSAKEKEKRIRQAAVFVIIITIVLTHFPVLSHVRRRVEAQRA